MINPILLAYTLKLNDLNIYVRYSVIFFVIIFLGASLVFLTKIKSIKNCQTLVQDYNKVEKINTEDVKQAFFIISPYLPISKGKQILPYFLFGKINIYCILESFWWSEYSRMKINKNRLALNILLFARFASLLMAISMFYTLLFWRMGINEFQNPDFIFITIIMFVWSVGLAIIPSFYIYDKINHYLEKTKMISQKDKNKIKSFAKLFFLWQFVDVVFEIFRVVFWIKNYIKYKNTQK